MSLCEKDKALPEWPYPIHYKQEQQIDTDVLVMVGGISGCWAAISAAESKGVRVALAKKGRHDKKRSRRTGRRSLGKSHDKSSVQDGS